MARRLLPEVDAEFVLGSGRVPGGVLGAGSALLWWGS